MKHDMQIRLLAAAVSLASCSAAWAIEPQSIRLTDGILFTPSLMVSEKYDDNIRAAENNEESSWITTVSPTLTLSAEGRKSAYRLSYNAVSDTFHSSQDDNNVDHHLTADAAFEFDARNRAKLAAGYHEIEDTVSDTSNTTNDQYNTRNVGGVYSFGAQTARMQIEAGANYEELRYTDGLIANEAKERDTTALRSTLFYRVAPKTKLLVEGRHTDYDYLSNQRLDSTGVAGLVGATWEATAKTTGEFKIGRERKNFDDDTVDDASKGMWEAGVVWAPRSYSRFNLNTRQGFDEGDNGASTIESRTYTLGWEHDWSSYLTSKVSYSDTSRDYQDISRQDDLNNIGLSLTYKARRWLDVGIGYTYSENDSDVAGESFERNVFALTVNASL